MEERDAAVKRYHAVRMEIEDACVTAGRNSDAVQLVGVTKTIQPEVINAVLDAGMTIIGENRVQEFLSKCDQYHLQGVKVHFIGTLQKNKVRQIVDRVDMIESVDSYALAVEIDKRAGVCHRIMPILVQINIDTQPSKSGILPQEAIALMQQLSKLENIKVKGLMAIPDPQKGEESFMRMQKLFEQIKQVKIPGIEMEQLSMGMSGDYKEAIRYGATLVRVGRGIFGERHIRIDKG